MMESDYRKKTSEVAEQRRALEKNWTDFEAAKIQAQTQLEELASQVIRKAEPGSTQDDVTRELEADPKAKFLMKQIESLSGKLKQIEDVTKQVAEGQQSFKQTLMVNEHRQVLARLKEKDPDLDVSALTTFAKENYIPRLDLAYKVMNFDRFMEHTAKEAAAKAKAEGVEEGKRLAITPTLPQKARYLAPELSKDAPKTMDEAHQAALNDPEIIGLLTQGIGAT
jgi:hypothetical protein